MTPIKTVFLGTPQFADVHLKSLLANPKFKVVGVVTQPDRPAGRKMQLTPSSVKKTALENNLQCITPESLRKQPEFFEQIKSWRADVAVVVAFGQILSQEFLDSFKFGAVNVHGSLLPRWRGAAPIQRCLEYGDTETGVSLQKMVKKLDAGPVIGERVYKISEETTATDLFSELAISGCQLLNEDLPRYVSGEIQPKEQDESAVTYAHKIEKEESLISWSWPAEKIHNRVRAFNAGPGTYVVFQGKRLKIHRTQRVNKATVYELAGEILEAQGEDLIISTGLGAVKILELQPESKNKMNSAEFLKSHSSLKKGALFV